MVDVNLPMLIFLTEIYRRNPQAYGNRICEKIIYDTNGKLRFTTPDFGDAYSKHGKNKIFYEIKSSYLRLETNTFRITHIRDYQNFDYFIICFIDRSDNFKPYFYFLPKSFICNNFTLTPMNNTKKANMGNLNIDKAMSINREEAFYRFESASLLNGTSYEDLMAYLKVKDNQGNAIVNPNKRTYNKQVKFSFVAKSALINGKTNIEAITKLANYLGPFRALDYFPPFWLSKEKTTLRKVKLNLGNYYLNPKISPRDTRYIINRGNRKTGLDIKLIEE